MAPPTKNNNWKWFFGIVVVLALGTSVFLIWINLRLQLTPAQLEGARARWEAKGPADYVMIYSTHKNEESSDDHYVVKVRGKKAYEALVNGLKEPEDRLAYHGMTALYDYIERFLELDSEKGKPRVYARGVFDADTGAIRSYVRRVMGGRERLEIRIQPLETK